MSLVQWDDHRSNISFPLGPITFLFLPLTDIIPSLYCSSLSVSLYAWSVPKTCFTLVLEIYFSWSHYWNKEVAQLYKLYLTCTSSFWLSSITVSCQPGRCWKVESTAFPAQWFYMHLWVPFPFLPSYTLWSSQKALYIMPKNFATCFRVSLISFPKRTSFYWSRVQ